MSSCSKKSMLKIASRHKTSVFDIQQRIKERLSKPSKIHAEIQLVLFYEEKVTTLHPRVICSSKSACYLCQLFLNIHGQYYIPSTHGRLYDTWSWPTSTQLSCARDPCRTRYKFETMLPEFSQAIDQKIEECLGHALRTRGVDPLESRVDIVSAITPSLRSHVSARSSCKRSSNSRSSTSSVETPKQLMDMSYPSLPLVLEVTAPTLSHTHSAPSDEIITPITLGHPSSPQPPSQIWEDSSVEAASFVIRRHSSEEAQAEPLSLQIGDIASQSFGLDSLFQIHVPGLHVNLHVVGQHAQENQPTYRPLLLEIQCLSSSEMESNNDLVHFVDLDEGDWVEQSTPEGVLLSLGGLLLKRKSTLLRLRARSS